MTQPMDPRDVDCWRADKMGKATLVTSEHVMVGLNAFESGQAHAPHAHDGMDKVYQVLQGVGHFQVGEESFDLRAGQLVVAPAGVSHGVENRSGERLLVLVTLSPPPAGK